MKYFTLFTLMVTSLAFAQVDKPMGSIAIPRVNTPAPVTPPAAAPVPSPFILNPPKVNNSFSIGKESKPFSMFQEDKFVSRSSEYADRVAIKPRGESNEPYRGNLDFGIVKTKSPYIVLTARDFGAQDGDRVKVTQNDKIIVSDATLTNNGQGITINLMEGFNNIKIEALNQGTSGPNTGEFVLYDNKEERLAGNDWNLATGFFAKFIVLKE